MSKSTALEKTQEGGLLVLREYEDQWEVLETRRQAHAHALMKTVIDEGLLLNEVKEKFGGEMFAKFCEDIGIKERMGYYRIKIATSESAFIHSLSSIGKAVSWLPLLESGDVIEYDDRLEFSDGRSVSLVEGQDWSREDVLDYMRSVRETQKELDRENKSLKKKVKDAEAELDHAVGTNEKLKKQNEALAGGFREDNAVDDKLEVMFDLVTRMAQVSDDLVELAEEMASDQVMNFNSICDQAGFISKKRMPTPRPGAGQE